MKRKTATRIFTFIIVVVVVIIIDFHAAICVFCGSMFKKERHIATTSNCLRKIVILIFLNIFEIPMKSIKSTIYADKKKSMTAFNAERKAIHY